MDGPTIFLGIVVVAVTAMVIYMFIDVSKYKEMTEKELKDNDKDLATAKEEAAKKIAAETKEREGNVNYIIDKTNEANQNLYTRFDKDVTSMQNNLKDLNNASASMSSVMRVTGGPAPATGATGTATGSTVLGGTATNTSGRAITELPGSGTPNLELISSVMATNGMTVKNTLKADKVQLGDKFMLSGVGDAHANDDWLRMFDKDGKDYHGGIAMRRLWTRDEAHLNGQTNVSGNLNVRGGSSEHNPGGWWTHFPWSGDNKNYIRGDTEIRGNTNNIGDLNVGRNANVQGRLHFTDPGMAKGWSFAGNNSDSYYLEKKIDGPNVSHLRLTLNDDNDESLQIWGGSCAAGDCSGAGTQKHKFDAAGNASHTNMLKVNRSDNDRYPAGWGAGVHAWDVYVNGTVGAGVNGGLSAYMNSAGDLFAGRNATVNGNLRTNGGITMPGGATVYGDGRMHVSGGELLYLLNKNGVMVGREWGGNGNLQVQGNSWTWGTSHTGGDHLFTGGNNWIVHTPDDGRTSMYIAPANAYGQWDWQWGKGIEMKGDGTVEVKGNDVVAPRICAGSVCLKGEGNTLVMESRDRSKRVNLQSLP